MGVGKGLQRGLHLMESAYRMTESMFLRLDPLFYAMGYERAGRWVRPAEKLVKRALFDCRMCGQCVLHSTGMVCPMTCPKNIRNGPCGGVRINGHCEVDPDRKCTWLEAHERSLRMPLYGDQMKDIQPPVDQRLEGTSAWVNWLQERSARGVPTRSRTGEGTGNKG